MDGSTDGSAAMLERLDVPYALHCVRGEQAGPGIARNRGAAAASGRVLLFLDDDVLADAGLAGAHLAAHQGAADEVVCLGHLFTLAPSRLSPWEQYLCQRLDEHYKKLAQPGYVPNFWDCLSGSLSLSRYLWAQCGGFDPTFCVARHDDIELGYRLAALGARFVYHPGAVGYHRFAKSFQQGINDAFVEGLSAQRLAARYPDLRPAVIGARWKRYSALIKLGIALFLPDFRRHQRLAELAARFMALILALRLPLALSRPIYQSVYHLYFWLGVRAESAGSIRSWPFGGSPV